MRLGPAKDLVSSTNGFTLACRMTSSKAATLRGTSWALDAAAAEAGAEPGALGAGAAPVGGHTGPAARSSIRDVAASSLG